MESIKHVVVYGLGNFGYALLKHLDVNPRDEYRLFGFGRSAEVMESLRHERRHPFVRTDGIIGDEVVFPASLEEVEVDVLILAVTAQAVPEVLARCAKLPGSKSLLIINTAKALVPETGERLSLLAERVMADRPYRYVYVAGGTIAEDLYNAHPLGATIASTDPEALAQAERLLASPHLRLYPTDDVRGVEYCAAFKNVISVFAGIVYGLGWPYGSETYFISRFSREIERLVTLELGGQSDTFSMDSQCWGNDLWMSCTGRTRNREFGERIGRGDSPNAALAAMKQERKSVEGWSTIRALPSLTERLQAYPFLAATHRIVTQGSAPAETIRRLIEARII